MSDISLLMDELEERMMKSEEALTEKLSGIRTDKASPALVENITFEYYGAQTRIRDAAGISPTIAASFFNRNSWLFFNSL